MNPVVSRAQGRPRVKGGAAARNRERRGQEPITSPAQKAGLFAFPATSDKRLKLVAFFNVYYGKTGLDNQTHTTSPSARQAHPSRELPRPSHPAFYVRDDRDPPLWSRRDNVDVASDFGLGSTTTHGHDGHCACLTSENCPLCKINSLIAIHSWRYPRKRGIPYAVLSRFDP
jgi:hypothetical protein